MSGEEQNVSQTVDTVVTINRDPEDNSFSSTASGGLVVSPVNASLALEDEVEGEALQFRLYYSEYDKGIKLERVN